MRMTSRFDGKCRKCGGPIRTGEIIDYEKSLGGAAHMRCVDGSQRALPDDEQEKIADRLLFCRSEDFENYVHQWINCEPTEVPHGESY